MQAKNVTLCHPTPDRQPCDVGTDRLDAVGNALRWTGHQEIMTQHSHTSLARNPKFAAQQNAGAGSTVRPWRGQHCKRCRYVGQGLVPRDVPWVAIGQINDLGSLLRQPRAAGEKMAASGCHNDRVHAHGRVRSTHHHSFPPSCWDLARVVSKSANLARHGHVRLESSARDSRENVIVSIIAVRLANNSII